MSKKRHISFWLTEEDMNGYQHQILMPVIFCEDCKYWAEAGREYNPNTNSWSAVMVCDYDECPEGCGHTCWSTDADDFCSRGERKGD